MWTRRNRRLSGYDWRSGKVVSSKEPEKLVGFRMPVSHYSKLKAIAEKRRVPVAQLINEVLDNKLHLKPKTNTDKPQDPTED